jgi:hypothetical protein
MARRLQLGMASVLRSAPGRLVTAADRDGQALAKAVVVQRTGWACDLVRKMTATTLRAHWTHGDINRITRPDATGKPLPAFAYKALERLGWRVGAPEGVWVCSRLRRIAAENARAPRAGQELERNAVAAGAQRDPHPAAHAGGACRDRDRGGGCAWHLCAVSTLHGLVAACSCAR